ncbi:MAG TPA: hypothetical protein VGR67_15625 [Candidatus Polarisedimenticolia bacterium]|jgi:hypothetical protein|nr:hypothetical protein [Candidatus Polarisedimenticolia bacterium]
MSGPRKIQIVGALLAALLGPLLTKAAPPKPAPTPPGSFSFAALGDAPYYAWEEIQFSLILRELQANDLAWVLHVGDIFWHPCSDGMYRAALGRFNRLRHPVIYTPGDNEWADCWERGSGGFAPRERLARIRRIFFPDPQRSLGIRRLRLQSQGGAGDYPEFVENARWFREGFLFATFDLPGTENGMAPFPGRTPADDVAAKRRTEAAAAWLRETFEEAACRKAQAAIVAFHANAGLEEPAADPYRMAYDPFLAGLEKEVGRFGGPVLVVHGDGHEYVVDHPLVSRATGRRLTNLTRVQVPGSPEVGWVRIVVTPGAAQPFAFEKHVLPRWKYW